MIKRKTTKEILVESFKELAEQKPVDKITVQEIVDNCGFSVATFYRHFHDKYELIAWEYTGARKAILDRYFSDGITWKQMLLEGGKFYRGRKDYMVNLLQNTTGHDRFIRYMVEINTRLVSEKVQEASGQETLSDDLQILIKIYVSGMVLMACEGILEGIPITVEHMADLFEQAIPEPLRPYLMRGK